MRTINRLLILFATIFLGLPLYAQNASVTGNVVDPQHAGIKGSAVTLINVNTQVKVETRSDANGDFILPPVAPGSYEIKAEANGFGPTVITGITLEVNQSKVVTLTMKMGAVRQSVEVTDTPAELNLDRADRSLMIEPTFVESIPLNIRNPLQMINDAAGVTKGDDGLSGTNSTSESRTNTYRINGAKGATTDVLIDGATNTTAYYNQDAGVPGVDSVQEYRVYTDAYSPEFGRTSGGIVSYALRSGTNALHGSTWEYFRNQALDANGFNANLAGLPKGSFGRNQFGFRLGGPVVLPKAYNGHSKTFFFFSWDGLRDTSAGSFTGTVPTALERTGDFSQTFDAKGNLIVIYNPASTTPNAAGSNYTRTPFAGNKIPNPNPLGLAMLALYPMPNQHGQGQSNIDNFYSNAPSTDDNNSYDTRIDHQFNDRHSIFGHYTDFTNRINYSDYFGNGLSPEDANDRIPGKNIDVDHTWVIKPNLIFEHHLSWAHSESNRNESVLKSPGSLGINASAAPGITANMTPQISIAGATATGSESTLGNYYPYERNYSSVYQYAADSTWEKGKHILKFGIDLRRYPTQLWDPEQMSINAGTNFTNGPNTTSPSPMADSGSGMAELLLGLATVTSGYEPETKSVHYYYGAYIQDTYKVTPKLTATYGLRYSYEAGDVEENNLLNYVNTTAPSPIAAQVPSIPNLVGGVGIPGLNGTSRQLQVSEKLHFDPRLGLAYQLNEKTIVHSGFGVFHHPAAAWQQYPNAAGAIRTSTSIDAAPNGEQPLSGYSLSNPFPSGLPEPYGNAAGLGIDLGQSIAGPGRKQNVPYQVNYSFDIQRSLPANFVVTAAYAGSEGVHLMQPLYLDQIPDADLGLGSKLRTTVANPFYGVITDPTSMLSKSTVTYEQLLRPFPQFTGLEQINSGVGHSTYNAGQLTVEHRSKQGLSLVFAYTFSKALDNVGEMTSVAGTYTGFQDVYCPRCDKSRSDQNETHVVRWNTSYELPFGKNKPFLNQGFLAPIVGGWQVSGIYTLDTGEPLTVSSPNYSYSYSGGGFRPDVTGVSDKLLGGSQIKLGGQYFNAAAFTQTPNYTFGNAPRHLADIDAPKSWDFDAMVEKNTHITEGYVLTFRAEAFNALNNVVFAGPTTSVTSASFGQMATLSQTNTPRNVQASLRLTF
ncbi:carboxypeptidase regulatory-like domain-containing protein [Acidicapsa acidisoli]|uniref:carboxypeptidase regulatory-like domain-containing protein n=1 Tax=Acidicapsa acidisoli TaxID=1615681 RepID=UPI0021E06168|nr:carboxypeptidase regulatory-like domain-containing protein [Acidicapsa acidisoli]